MSTIPRCRRTCISYLSLFIFFLCFAIAGNGLAQSSAFEPAGEDASLLKTLSANGEKHYKEDLAALPSKNKKDFEEVYKLRWNNIKEKFDSKEVFTYAPAQQYLDAMVADIIQANPSLKDHPFNCYFSRSAVPNAAYIGQGIILFNMGLFERLDNEDEAAFVLCHEIAHFLLRHSENSIAKYVATINSDEFQQQLRKIKNEEYGKREQLEKLVNNITFNSRRHGRDHESEADSMAVELLRNSRFDVGASVSALALLDSIDSEKLDMAACLEKMFNAKNYPFQKKWIAKEEGLLGGHANLKTDEKLEDSLKTHPDCKIRIKQIEPLVSRYRHAARPGGASTAAAFEKWKEAFRYETIEYAFTSKNYTQSLYHTIALLQQKAGDPYLVTQVGRVMNGLYAAQKGHTLSKVADLPAPGYSPSYNLLLQFVQNLYLENIASIGYYYLNQYHPVMDNYPSFKTAYDTSVQITAGK